MTKKKTNKIKRYVLLARANPVQAYIDLINLILILTAFSVIFSFIVWVENVFKGTKHINPVVFQNGGFALYWHGLLVALAILIGILYILRKAKKVGIKNEYIIAVAFWAVFGGILGGRIAFVLANWDFYSKNLPQTLNIWEGGISFYGSLLVGFLAITTYSILRKINTLKVLDLFSPALFLGLSIGSWGSFFNQERLGIPTDSFLRMYVEPSNRPWIYQKFSYFHPIFLYESLVFFLLFIILLIIKKRKKELKTGMLFSLAILFYSLTKFFLGFLIIESSAIWVFNLTQITSIIFAITAITSLILIRRKNEKN